MVLNPLKSRIKNRLSKEEIQTLASEILSGQIGQAEIRRILALSDERLLFNLYWVLATVADRSPGALKGLEEVLFNGMQRHRGNESVVRNVLGIFKRVPVPEAIEDALYHFCFGVVQAAGSPVAHRSFAMVVCAQICLKFPELSPELLSVAKIAEETYGEESPGIRSAARQVFRMLTPR